MSFTYLLPYLYCFIHLCVFRYHACSLWVQYIDKLRIIQVWTVQICGDSNSIIRSLKMDTYGIITH